MATAQLTPPPSVSLNGADFTIAGVPSFSVFYVIAEKDLENVKLSIGSDDSSVWRVNGKEVIRVYAGRDYDKDTDQSKPLTLMGRRSM